MKDARRKRKDIENFSPKGQMDKIKGKKVCGE